MSGFGPDVVSLVSPMRIKLLDFLCSGIHSYVLLSPYVCFISFLNFDVCVHGDDESISYGFFMRTKRLCVLIHIILKIRLAPMYMFKTSCIMLLAILRWCFFYGSCLLFMVHVYLCYTCGHLLGKGWPLDSLVLVCLSPALMVTWVRCGT